MSALDALQDCLAAEHAAVYGYGVLGGVLARTAPGSADQARAEAAYAEHVRRRDELTMLLTRLHATPVAAEPAYELEFPVTSTGACRRLGRLLEHRLAAVYAAAVSQTVGRTRARAAEALVDAALREVAWGAPVEAFPGVAEL